ncbi:basic-leucine zipper transcription factor [Mucor lusitanicus]|uniref:Basic-leucine zipper transcription factor n=2 Tax=Mucor circinelloides f. lusitanicus TaxID=29924 RepID=A0A168PIL5_MUCCL|nr:basic-leucine zipper transcription factor [Mucor lusitanicus]OAD07785.1 basic-leucine zipper transcription factor [Mucor lusitanicus CBS 277.49]
MLWTDIQQPMYPLFSQNASMLPPNTTLLQSDDFKFTPQSAHLYDPSSYYMSPQQQQQQQAQTFITAGSMSSSGTEDEDLTAITPRRNSCTQSTRKRKLSSTDDANDEKRKHFLERNRQAALKCRQRKKQWLTNLQERVEFLANDNEQLQLQANVMRDEVIHLRNLLLAHKNCSMAPQYHDLYNTANKVFAE